MNELNISLVNRINSLLEENNITLNKLAKKSGLRQSTLNNIMNDGRIPTLTTICAIAEGFNMPVTEFLNFPPYNKTTTPEEVAVNNIHSIY